MIKKIGVLLLISTTLISQDKGQFESYSNPFYKTIVTKSNDYNQKEKEESTPLLFSEEENVDSFKQEIDPEKESKSLINEDEEEDFEIPAFLRKQKN